MLDLTADQIAKLNDEDLRELVFKLCEAELRRNNLPVVSVTAGGNQTASDGGVDVCVDIPTPVTLDFIPRSQTVFQVKCEDIPAGKVIKEMCPQGSVRESIVQLIEAQGAYIIVSSKGTVAHSRLKERLAAMRVAIEALPNAASVHLDFYDRKRLATWVRGYPGVEQWTRERIGEPLSGWKSYGNWTGDKTASPYLKDELGRILSKSSGSSEPMSVEVGINAMRERLAKPGESLRLIGLSGTGKTRMVQALFESGVGASPLDTSTVVYTDQGLSPSPSARDMMQRLGANGLRAIVVVDNCNPATHQALTQIVASYPDYLSLITVEYDVMDDEPEETQVFELTGSSAIVLEEILARHAAHIAQNDRLRIVEFSDGNARVALALAHTVKKGQTLGILNHADLFRRLFMQNHEPNDALLRAAEVCSLVYSFDGLLDSADAELPVLARLANLDPKELFRQVTELKRRKLVQTRSKWRAVLPHALANRLAKQALANLPQSAVVSAFEGHVRLLKSFSRRLSYLHDSPEACAIAKSWMADEKSLANPITLNELGRTLFLNLAPLIPEQALGALELAVNGEQGAVFTAPVFPSRDKWIALARSLAYAPALFDRAASICLIYARSEESNQQTGRNMWKELFLIHLSGTLAPQQQRIHFLRKALVGTEPQQIGLVIDAIASMLESSNFRSSHNFSFGAHPRGYGWQPASADDAKTWYRGGFEFALEVASLDLGYRDLIRATVARQFRRLWGNLDMHQEIAALVQILAGRDGWSEGWAAIRLVLRYDSKAMSPEHRTTLEELEILLRPVTLEQNIRSYVFSKAWGHLDIADVDDAEDGGLANVGSMDAYQRLEARIVGLAKEVSDDEPLLQRLLPDLLTDGSGRQFAFGKGLALASLDIAVRWSQLRVAFSKIDSTKRNTQLLAGFVEGAFQADSVTIEGILEAAVRDSILAEYFPLLERSLWNDQAGKRLLDSLDYSVAPISRYYVVKYGQIGRGMSAALYRSILLRLAQVPGGYQIAVDELGMEFHAHSGEKSTPSPELISLGRELLCMCDFEFNDDNFAHHLNEIAVVCMQGQDAAVAAASLCQCFAEALREYKSGADSCGELAETLFRHQPVAALDAFLGGPPTALGYPLLARLSLSRKKVVHSADVETLVAWVSVNPSARAPLLAAEIEIYCADGDGLFTWSPIAASLLAVAPNKQAVLDAFRIHLYPMVWSGSLAQFLRPYFELTEQLAKGDDPTVATWAKTQLASMAERTSGESRADRRTDESFE